MDIPQRISRMKEIAYDLWFSWQTETQELFRILDKQLWEETNHNPVKFLLRLYPHRLEQGAVDPVFLTLYDRLTAKFDRCLQKPTWYEKNLPSDPMLIAYFSAELGIHESLPFYGGGLGVLAGDHCKSSGDLGIPLVGISLLYKHGYFAQKINRDGWQEATYPLINFREIPIILCTKPDGTPLKVSVQIGEKLVCIQIWRQIMGRVKLYLLDADIDPNSPTDRKLTQRLYGGDEHTRIAQEIILGIGGVKALRQLGLTPTVWHINEGHAAFLIIERIRELTEQGIPFSAAQESIKANTLFTTHTPVPAGHDVFHKEMILYYLGQIIDQFTITPEEFLALGWDQERDVFNMTKLALFHSAYTNGVSKIHAQVSKKNFRSMYPDIPSEDIPISSVTNGIHLPSWAAPKMKKLFQQYLGDNWLEDSTNPQLWEKVRQIPDEELWQTHQRLKKKMIHFVRSNVYHRMKRNLEPAAKIRESINRLSTETLTIGFARRFATYKRADLLLSDPDRLSQLLNHPQRPMVIIFAGKAHPADHPGQWIIKRLFDLEKEKRFQGKLIFVENYDMHVARYLLQGVDIWLNTPKQPLEASGTSGQKAAVNGVINCSIPDGWWPEAANGENGFTIGKDQGFLDENMQDDADRLSLFDLLEQEIIPCYYQQTENYPGKWVHRMKESLATIPYYFNSERMVKEYYERFYLPVSLKQW